MHQSRPVLWFLKPLLNTPLPKAVMCTVRHNHKVGQMLETEKDDMKS